MGNAVCKITDGIDSVSLIGDVFYIDDWRPSGMAFKGDGHWQDSVFADGRRLTQYSVANYTETITISQRSLSQNAAIRQINKLSGILLTAAKFSVKPKHGRRPIYMEVKATAEDNTRYARIHAGHVGEYGNPFAQPWLQPDCSVAVTNVPVVIERGPWLEVPPGMDVCQEISPTGTPSEATYYTYEDIILGNHPDNPVITWPAFALWKLNETSGTVAANSSQYAGLDGDYGAGVSLDNLRFWNAVDPTAFMNLSDPNLDIYSTALNQRFNGLEGSLLAWVNTSGLIWTGGNNHYFINIQVNANTYLRIYHPGTVINNSVQWEYAGGGPATTHRVDDFSPIDTWFSVGMTWSQAQLGFKNVRFYLNGGLVKSEFYSSSWAGNLDPATAVIGQLDNANSSGEGAASDLAWVGLWNAPLTDDDMALIGVPNFGFVETTDLPCEEIVAYVGNKQNNARLTHGFTVDISGPTFGSNIITSTPPVALLPATIGAGDIVYFGIQTSTGSGLAHGPFNSIVFDIATAANATTSYAYTWEYHLGGSPGTWQALAYVDNTDGFQETGINSVHWVQPDDWTTVAVNGVTALWVRLRVTSVSGTWTQPIAQDIPYTVVSNTVDIPESAVGGSLQSLGRMSLYNQADPIGDDQNMFWERVAIGRRTYDLGQNFVSYLSLTDRAGQNPPGVTVSVGTNTSFQNDTTAVTGRSVNLVAGTTTLLPRWTVTVDWASVPSYLGSYKVFVLYHLVGLGSAGDTTEFRVKAGSGYNHIAIDTGPYVLSLASPRPSYTVHEVGEITIRPDSFIGDSLDQIQFSWWSTANLTMDIDFHALVLIPTDEWFGDFGTDPLISGDLAQVSAARYLALDSTRYLDRSVVADVREVGTDLSVARWKQSHNGPIKINYTDRQQFHFLFMRSDQEDAYTYMALPHAAATISLFRNRAYDYGRGDE